VGGSQPPRRPRRPRRPPPRPLPPAPRHTHVRPPCPRGGPCAARPDACSRLARLSSMRRKHSGRSPPPPRPRVARGGPAPSSPSSSSSPQKYLNGSFQMSCRAPPVPSAFAVDPPPPAPRPSIALRTWPPFASKLCKLWMERDRHCPPSFRVRPCGREGVGRDPTPAGRGRRFTKRLRPHAAPPALQGAQQRPPDAPPRIQADPEPRRRAGRAGSSTPTGEAGARVTRA
jgi:hypothetical protein